MLSICSHTTVKMIPGTERNKGKKSGLVGTNCIKINQSEINVFLSVIDDSQSFLFIFFFFFFFEKHIICIMFFV